jgi:hypothetical protein
VISRSHVSRIPGQKQKLPGNQMEKNLMKLRRNSCIVLTTVAALALFPVIVHSQEVRSAESGDVQFELIGQVTNASPTTSLQYGYLSFINGISGLVPIFNPGPQNETTALFTFYNDTVNETVINNGPIRIINRVGTTTIYLNSGGIGNFSDPNSFRTGVPIQESVLRHQVIIDTVTGSFTTTFANTITFVTRFGIGNSHFRLGKMGQTFRTTVFGRLTAQAPPSAYIAGFAVGPDLVRP